MVTPTAPEPVSPQGAVLSLFRNDAAVDELLASEEPIDHAGLAGLAKRAGLPEVAARLSWLAPRAEAEGVDFFGAAVQIMEREHWLQQIKLYAEGVHRFPDGAVVAATIDVRRVEKCIVLPLRIGELVDEVLLFSCRRLSDESTGLVPIAVYNSLQKAGIVPQKCVLRQEPELGCFSSGCTGTCRLRTAMEDDVEVILGCLCT